MDIPYIRVGGRLVSTDSEEGKEYLKWERKPNYNPNAPENQFPRMLYRAMKRPDGVVSVNEVHDGPLGGVMGAAENFNRQCQKIVKNEQEMQAAFESGWHPTQGAALEAFEAMERDRGDMAAHRAYEDRNMGDLAQAERKAAEDATPEHVAEVREKPKAKRSYKRRDAAAA